MKIFFLVGLLNIPQSADVRRKSSRCYYHYQGPTEAKTRPSPTSRDLIFHFHTFLTSNTLRAFKEDWTLGSELMWCLLVLFKYRHKERLNMLLKYWQCPIVLNGFNLYLTLFSCNAISDWNLEKISVGYLNFLCSCKHSHNARLIINCNNQYWISIRLVSPYTTYSTSLLDGILCENLV